MSKRYYNNLKYTDQSTEEIKPVDQVEETKVEETEEVKEEIKIEPAPTLPEKIKTVKAKSLLVREKPEKDSKILGVLLLGEKITVLETVNDWYKVEAQDGKARGYCMSAYIE